MIREIRTRPEHLRKRKTEEGYNHYYHDKERVRKALQEEFKEEIPRRKKLKNFLDGF